MKNNFFISHFWVWKKGRETGKRERKKSQCGEGEQWNGGREAGSSVPIQWRVDALYAWGLVGLTQKHWHEREEWELSLAIDN